MNDAELQAQVLKLLLDVAPDIEPDKLKREIPFRSQFDFDSMDTLNFAVALCDEFAIDIPETAYPKLSSLANTVAYVRAQLALKTH